jgi:hypothetical protein
VVRPQPVKALGVRRTIRAPVLAVLCVLGFGFPVQPRVQASSSAGASAISGTLVLRGAMTSAVTIRMTGAFSVGGAANLHWDLPLVRSVSVNGYSEQVIARSFAFDVPPDASAIALVDGRTVRRFSWAAPPADTVIHVTETLRLLVRTGLTPFHSAASYPLAALPPDTAGDLRTTALLHLPTQADPQLRRFQRNRSEQDLVVTVANWVASTTQFGATRPDSIAAGWVLAHHQATCRGYDNLMAGILRRLGIPTRIIFGWASPVPVSLPGPNGGTSFVRWVPDGRDGGLHTWLTVYFPGAGWVPFDPQHEKFFVDTRHYAFFTNVDAGDPHVGTWTAQYRAGTNATGAALSNGSLEIVPGDGMASQVDVTTRDDVHVTLRGITHDVTNTLLFSR